MTPGGLSFQNPFRCCGMTGPTHRCEPRQRLAVGTELRRCRQAALCRQLVATGPCGLDRRALGERVAPVRGHRQPVPLNDASRSALG